MPKSSSKVVTVVSKSHNEMLLTGLWSAFMTQSKVDLCLLEWGRRSLVAHQVVADVFLSTEKLLDGTLSEISCDPKDLMEHLEHLLEFMYTGRVTVSRDKLDDLLDIAYKLEFEVLVEALQATGSTTSPSEGQEVAVSVRRKQLKPSKVVKPPESEISKCDDPVESDPESVDAVVSDQESSNNDDSVGDAIPSDSESPKRKRRPVRRPKPRSGQSKSSGTVSAIRHCSWSGCDFTCEDRTEMTRHRRTHQYKCDRCDFANLKRSQVTAHYKKVHLQIRPCICDTCGFAAFNNHLLVQHNRTHTGERPFICEVCGRAFADRSSFARHSKVHMANRPRPFTCDLCTFRSHRKYVYATHMKTVHGPDSKHSLSRHSQRHCKPIPGKPFPCPACGRTFQLLRFLKAHMKVDHPDLMDVAVDSYPNSTESLAKNEEPVVIIGSNSPKKRSGGDLPMNSDDNNII